MSPARMATLNTTLVLNTDSTARYASANAKGSSMFVNVWIHTVHDDVHGAMFLLECNLCEWRSNAFRLRTAEQMQSEHAASHRADNHGRQTAKAAR